MNEADLGKSILTSVLQGCAVVIIPTFKDGNVADVELTVVMTDLLPQLQMFMNSTRANGLTASGVVSSDTKADHEIN